MSKTILIIDDTFLKVAGIKHCLEQMTEFEVVLKHDISSGIEYLDKEIDNIKLVLLDMCVPFNPTDDSLSAV